MSNRPKGKRASKRQDSHKKSDGLKTGQATSGGVVTPEDLPNGHRLTLTFPFTDVGIHTQMIETVLSPVATSLSSPHLSQADIHRFCKTITFMFLEEVRAIEVDELENQYEFERVTQETSTGLLFRTRVQIRFEKPIQKGYVKTVSFSNLRDELVQDNPELKGKRYRNSDLQISDVELAKSVVESATKPYVPYKASREFLFVIDETGDPAANLKPGSHELFVTVSLAIDTAISDKARDEVKRIIDLYGFGAEIKSKNLNSRKKKKAEIKSELDKCIRQYAEKSLVTAQNKVGRHREIHLVSIETAYRSGRFTRDPSMEQQELADDQGEALLNLSSTVTFCAILAFCEREKAHGTILYDRMNRTRKNEVVEEALQYCLLAHRISSGDSPIKLKFVSSSQEPLIGLADYAAGEIRERILGRESNWQVIESLLPTQLYDGSKRHIAYVTEDGKYAFWDLVSNQVVAELPD